MLHPRLLVHPWFCLSGSGGNRGTAFSDLTTRRFTGQYHEQALPGGEGLAYYGSWA